MSKMCIENGCSNPQFGGGYCRYHAYRRYMQGGDLFVRKRKTPIKKESAKRKKQHIRYIEQVKMFKQEMRDKGEYRCFISGEDFDDSIGGFCTVHHLRGRTGDYYLDKEFWILARNQIHLDVFHNECTIEELQKRPYWEDFMSRLRIKDLSSYHKILRRIEKNKEELFE